ncbi:MAG: iron-sulfur cluster assembly accessory protein [Planctomycetes bacterium]|nr:iron-sulfur cluster assembly accessory protein [Planctomycetota bacterium]
MAVTITENAAKEICNIVRQQELDPEKVSLRVGVKGGGCSGMSYIMEIDEAIPKQADQIFEQGGVKILIDTKSHLYLDGMTIDYQQNNMMGGGFEFNNPNAKKSCGCGTSFTA